MRLTQPKSLTERHIVPTGRVGKGGGRGGRREGWEGGSGGRVGGSYINEVPRDSLISLTIVFLAGYQKIMHRTHFVT